jgi:hypothetical protein
LPNARAKVTDPPASSRLQRAQGPGQATHKLALRNVPDVDDEVRRLIEVACQQSG